ncbi:MAG: HAMP domain-containing sensor histidine kinase [Candidatus Kaiserbacteria bacterium]|nr:HAMP domain-containing sensor histidine kinase [Candidatus Kaiserbacteria bacterium]
MDLNTCFATIGDLRSLALYANFVPAAASIILGGFVVWKANNRQKAIAFASFVGVFSLWLIANGIIWTSNNYYLVAGLWSPISYFELLFFLLLFRFFYLDVFDSIPRWLNIPVTLAAVGSFVINVLGQSVSGFDLSWCNMNDSELLASNNLYIEIAILLVVLGLGIYKFIKLKGNKNERVRLSIITISIVLFMGIFSGSEYIANNLGGNYTYELYALFAMPIFILLITVAITSYGTFRLGDTVAKALFYIFIVFSGAQFFFVTTTASVILITVAFLITLCFGALLLQSYERETRIRAELEISNRGQENLIHIINHQIKGYLGTARNVFAELLEGTDYGQMPEASKPLLSKGLEEMAAGVDYVQGILKGSNAHSGKLPYDMKPVDLKSVVSGLAIKQKEVAEKAGLSFESNITDGEYTITGDATMLEEAFKNLITNAIKYNNPNGSIAVSLSRSGQKILFSVKDTGMGISKEDEPKLFKPGGVGKDSIKYNVESSGFGLAFVKPVVEKHQGRVWFKSNSPEQGTAFFVELPVK